MYLLLWQHLDKKLCWVGGVLLCMFSLCDVCCPLCCCRSYILAYNSHGLKDIFNVHTLDLQVRLADVMHTLELLTCHTLLLLPPTMHHILKERVTMGCVCVGQLVVSCIVSLDPEGHWPARLAE